ncbi:hypothetical protein BGZ83_008424 [Gryganskiella cystojenkinii]|nr:hypothetical protein BGZ83_008424 [Gryganskiella cystojenkinii]
MRDQSVTVDAEHLMAFKHGKSRMAHYSEVSIPMAAPTTFARKMNDDTSDEDDVGFAPHNRGNKLKRRANMVTGGCRLSFPDASKDMVGLDLDDDIRASAAKSAVVTFSNTKSTRTVVTSAQHKQPHHYRSDGQQPQQQQQQRPTSRGGGASTAAADDADEAFSDEDPYAEIKINEILSPLESSTEILQRPQLRKLFQSPQLQIMAVHAMAMIEREKTVNKIMSRVALILQGDDPLYPQLGYGLGEGCSTALMGMPDQEEFITGNKKWKEHGEDKEEVQKTLSLLMDNINCSNQYIDLLSESRDAVNHVSKQKKQLWKKLKEKREKELRRRMLAKANGKSSHSQFMQQQHHREKHA